MNPVVKMGNGHGSAGGRNDGLQERSEKPDLRQS